MDNLPVMVAVEMVIVVAVVMAMKVVVGVAGVNVAGVDINDCKFIMDQVVPKKLGVICLP